MAWRLSLQQLIAWPRYAAAWLGWPGLGGLAAGLGALLAWLFLVLPLEAEGEAQRVRLAELEARWAAAQAVPLPAPETRALAGLPGGEVLLPLVGAVHASARHHQIALEQGEYVWQRAREGRPARYRMTFPARGSYPALRAWTAELSAAHPVLTLAEFDLRRDNIGTDMIEARVQFDVLVEESS